MSTVYYYNAIPEREWRLLFGNRFGAINLSSFRGPTTDARDMDDKIKAARRLAATLDSAFDFEWYWLDHPNEDRAMERLIREVTWKDSMSKPTFKDILASTKCPTPLSMDTKLPHEFDLYWDVKTFGELLRECDGKLSNKQLRLLAQSGFDTKNLPTV